MRRCPPLLLMLLIGAAMLVLDRMPGFGLPGGGWIGAALIAAGGGLAACASGQFILRRTNLLPFRAPGQLVTDGLFALSRNPIYLGMLLALIGLALLIDTPAALFGAGLFYTTANHVYIPEEEQAAAAQFGADYAAYRARVRRWI